MNNKLDFPIFDTNIKEVETSELIDKLGSIKTNSKLLYAIIYNEKCFPSVDYQRSLRSFWYSLVKPTLDRLGKLSPQDDTEDEMTKWDSELSRYVAKMVREGLLTYKDLNILDNSRQRQNPSDCYAIFSENLCKKTSIAPYPNILICTEKDTAYNIIEQIAVFFGCSCLSGAGQNSLGAMSSLLEGMNKNEEINILALTDYDPAGYSIAKTFHKQVIDLKDSLGIKSEITLERIGIIPSQLTENEIAINQYTPKGDLSKWVKDTGGINGAEKGLELDALSPTRIREIFIGELKKYIDTSVYQDFIKQENLKNKFLRLVAKKFELAFDEIFRELSPKVELISQFEESLFTDAGLGLRHINPDNFCISNANIDEEIKKYF